MRAYVDRLYDEQLMFSTLRREQIEQILSWAEARAQECRSDHEFDRFLSELRLMNRYMIQGVRFDDLIGKLAFTGEGQSEKNEQEEIASYRLPHQPDRYYRSIY